jgi:N-methylhydantoinase A
MVGVDVGGTFTDFCAFDESTKAIEVRKLPTTSDQSVALVEGLRRFAPTFGAIATVIHGTTVGTNAVLERKGARCGLITTRGFRDIVELRRRDRPRLYGLTGDFEPLVPRDMRMEVGERTGADGTVLEPVNDEDVRAAAEELRRRGAETVVIGFLHSYANPANERACAEIVRSMWPNDAVVSSADILAEYREFERFSTSVLNAYLMPAIGGYLGSVIEQLRGKGYRGDVKLVRSNGGLMSTELAQLQPVHTLLSGPAAGVVAAMEIARAGGYRNVVACDMGGTSLDLSLAADGAPAVRTSTEIEYGIPVSIPMIDIHTVGAGGGSIAWIDRGGLLQIGPQSAGSNPGPACYGKGGGRATVTDANVLLGRINPARAIAGKDGVELDVALAHRAIEKEIARPLRLSVHEAAAAIVTVANSRMAANVRKLTVEKGFDPRGFVLLAFGGAGPLHAAGIAREVGISRVLVPYYPGITCAIGAIMADVKHDAVQTIARPLESVKSEEVQGVFEEQIKHGTKVLDESGVKLSERRFVCQAELAYEGQTHVLTVPLTSPRVSRQRLVELFERRYVEGYGKALKGVPVFLINLRTSTIGVRPRVLMQWKNLRARENAAAQASATREVWFGGRRHKCRTYLRSALTPGTSLRGPAIVEQEDATTLIDPGCAAKVDKVGNLVIEVGR